MMVSCSKCSKMLKVKDEWAGKMLKCPACKTTFRADPAGKAAPAGGPKSVPPAKGKPMPKAGSAPKAKGGGLAIEWGTLVKWGLIAIVPLLILLFIVGPIRVKGQWEARQEETDKNVTDIVEFAMKAWASHEGEWNPSEARGQPSIGEIRFLPNIFAMSLGPTVKFDGYCSVGRFEGEYTFETGEAEFVLKTGGTMLPSGLYSDEEGTIMPGGQRESAPPGTPNRGGKLTPHNVKGKMVNGKPDVTINGKKTDIYYPPKLDDDGNVEEPNPASPATTEGAAESGDAEGEGE